MSAALHSAHQSRFNVTSPSARMNSTRQQEAGMAGDALVCATECSCRRCRLNRKASSYPAILRRGAHAAEFTSTSCMDKLPARCDSNSGAESARLAFSTCAGSRATFGTQQHAHCWRRPAPMAAYPFTVWSTALWTRCPDISALSRPRWRRALVSTKAHQAPTLRSSV